MSDIFSFPVMLRFIKQKYTDSVYIPSSQYKKTSSMIHLFISASDKIPELNHIERNIRSHILGFSRVSQTFPEAET